MISVLVLGQRPLGVDLILGMSGITALGGVIVKSPSDVSFCGGVVCTGAVMPSQRPGTATPVAEAATAIEGGAACVGGFESRRQAALKAADGAGEG